MDRLKELESFLHKMLSYADMDEARVCIQGDARCIVSDIREWDENMTAYVRARFQGCHVAVSHSSSSLSGFQVAITPGRRSTFLSNEFVVFAAVATVVALGTSFCMRYPI